MDWFLYDRDPRHERVKISNFKGGGQTLVAYKKV